MFRNKSTGDINWLGIFLTKFGVLFSLYMAHLGAHNNVWVKNVENTVLHGPRRTAAGFYEGDAEIRVVYNKEGHKERYFIYLPSKKMYALGKDGLAKDPKLLLGGLEKRVEKMNQEQAIEIFDEINGLRNKVYEKVDYHQKNNSNNRWEKRDWWPLW